MKTILLSSFRVTALFLLALLPFLTTSFPAAEPVSHDGEQDIGQLLRRAEQAFELEQEDAVILFNSIEELWTADGRAISTVHQIVLIRTGSAIRRFADLRIPYDGERQRFEVNTLRTWRLSDAQWIASGPTAQVETLPYAVDHAPDYCHRREMMLLHDGVELPCVLERSYTIEDMEPYRAGVEGHLSLALSVPAVVSRIVLGHPQQFPLSISASPGLPTPGQRLDPSSGLSLLTFELENTSPFPSPTTPESIRETPHILWSSWTDWAALGADLENRFGGAFQVGDELRERLKEHIDDARTEAEKARLTAQFINQTTRWIHDDMGWWPAPRPAERTWVTAYGDRVDRVVLAAALFQEAGLETDLIFIGDSIGPLNTTVPYLAWADGPGLLVLGTDLEACFDPATATLTNGLDDLFGRMLWQPAYDTEPAILWQDFGQPASFTVRFDLRFDGCSKNWSGTGVLSASGALCPFHRMSGLGSETQDFISGIAGSLLEGATVSGFNPAVFNRSAVTVGFGIELPAGEKDAMGRTKLAVGSAAILQPRLDHASVNLIEVSRESGIHFPSPIETGIELHLNPGELGVVYLPEARTVENGAGKACLTVERIETTAMEQSKTAGGQAEEVDSATGIERTIVLVRRLSLTKKDYEAKEWPDLRTLLLADDHERGRLILFEGTGSSISADPSE